jgi:hypothetical protein
VARVWRVVIGAFAVLAMSAACGASASPTSLSGGIGTSVSGTQTAAAAAATALPTQTQTPTSAAPLPSPPASTPGAPPATRINFLNGATSGVESGNLQPGQSLSYVLQAGQGQPLFVEVTSSSGDVTLSVKTEGGTSLVGPEARASTWQGTLPQTEDYYVTILGGPSAEAFTLSVEIASRIKFPAGAYSIKTRGTTVSGYTVAFTVFAIKDQKLVVTLFGVGSDAALAVWGYANRQAYLGSNAGQTEFALKIPATQDYIIKVVPNNGKVVDFVLSVSVQ